MPVFKLIALDCDGVILESVTAKTSAFSRLFEKYGSEAQRRIVDYHLGHGGVSRFVKFAWFYREILGLDITEDEQEELGRQFARFCLHEIMNVPTVPGAMEFILLYHNKIPLYVVSGTPHGELNEIIRTRNLDRFFKGCYGSPPGKTRILAEIVSKAGVSPSEVLMVGDSSTDLEAAQSVGTLFYGRGHHFSSSKWPWGEDLNGLVEYLKYGMS